MFELAERTRLDLADALARYPEFFAHFLQRMRDAIIESKAHAEDFFFARREFLYTPVELNAEVACEKFCQRRRRLPILDETTERAVSAFAERFVERERTGSIVGVLQFFQLLGGDAELASEFPV